jgi:hypothetical protein
MSMTTGLPRKAGKDTTKWVPIVEACIAAYPLNFRNKKVKVASLVATMGVWDPSFVKFPPTYQKSLLGKCLQKLGYEKHSRTPQGYIYVLKDKTES